MASEWKRDGEPETGYHLVDDRPFARGGSGEVWKAVGPGGIRVVLKRVPLAGKMAEAERKSLELLRNISAHPHLLGIHGFWIHDAELVIATELASGSLADRLRATGGTGIPVEELLDYMEDAAKGIDFLNSPVHQLDGKQVAVQHRDVKPDNLLLVGGSVKLSDFGLAKALEHQAASHTGVMTPAYAAPEAFVHQTTHRSDQYSLAASYVELRTGHCIFSGSVAQVMYGHLHGHPDLSGLTEAETKVVSRALAKKPDERFGSCRDFVAALRQSVSAHVQKLAATTAAPTWSTSPAADGLPSWPGPAARPAAAIAAAVATQNSTRSTMAPLDTQTTPVEKPQPVQTPVHAPARRRHKGLLIAVPLAAALVLVGWLIGITLERNRNHTKDQLDDNQQASRITEDSRHTSGAGERTGADRSKPVARQTEDATATESSTPEQSAPPVAEDEREPTKSRSTDEAKHPGEEPRPEPRETAKAKSTDANAPKEDSKSETTKSKARADTETPTEPARADARTPAKSEAEPPTPPPADQRNGNLADQGYALLKKYCYRCHGVDFKVPGYNVLDRDILVAKRGADEQPYVTPGKPDESYIWQRVGVDADMPPSGAKPSDSEKQLLKKWIEAGAPFPAPPAAERKFVSDKDVLGAIADHLHKTPIADRTYQRYFTLTHLYNNKTVRDDELRLYRAALAKMANSVSWKHSIVVPRPVDAAGTIFNVDLRDLGWDEANLWKEILKVYPYGLTHNQLPPDEEMRDLARDVYHLTASELPYLRADWFIATAARPPLYHTLLRLPKTAYELEQQLKVDTDTDFLRNKLVRAGFATSGVSSQNRIVDRHDSVYGAYWKSYDFRNSEGTANIFQFPLGPKFAKNPFDRQAFEHAGGELIFSLPNGLHGYLLVDNKGNRLDAGPIDIVHDELLTSGTPTIVTGISCMGCHKHGMIRFKDTLRTGHALSGEAREKVELLALKQDAMDKVLDKDEDQFLRSLDEAAGPFLKVGDDAGKNIRQFPEPVGAITRLYLKDIGPEEVACELGIPDPGQLQGAVRGNPKLRQLGLGPVVQGGKIKREAWESLKGFNSPMQESSRELELGTPFRIF